MGLFGSAGLKSAASSVAQILAALVGQDVVAKSFTSSQLTGADAFRALTTGARFHFGPGTLDFITSDGVITLTTGGSFTVGGDLALGASSDAVFGRNVRVNGNFTLGGVLLANNTAPTVVAGAGASVVSANGSACFEINLGGAAQTGTLTFPTAAHGWVVYMQNVTTPASFVLGQTGFTTTTATFTSYSRTTGAATNWNANDHMVCLAMAY